MNLEKFREKVFKFFYLNNHFISYYIDLHNEFFIYNQPKKHLNIIRDLPKDITEMIQNSTIIRPEYKKYFIKNPYVKDNRLNTVILFLLFMKYQSMIIDYNLKSLFKTEENIKEKIKNFFKDYVENSLKDVVEIFQNISKIKEDKKIEYFYKKEVKSSKNNWVKNTYEEYYKYLLKIIKKRNMFFVSKSIIEDIEKKFMKELEEEQNDKNDKLLEGRNSSNNSVSKSNDELYTVKSNNSDENNSSKNIEKIDETKRNDSIDKFTIIEKSLLDEENKINNEEYNLIIEETENKIEEIMDDEDEYIFTNYFTDAQNQILCTKRDLILKNFGYFFYEDYFKDINFIKMKKKFLILFPPSEEKNNYNNFEKQMTLNFPSTLKNYSNGDLYYPRIFLRPDRHFFEETFFTVGHNYFWDYIKNNNIHNKPNFEYGHGLLNQTNFELFEFNNKKNKDKIKQEDNGNKNNINKLLEIDESIPCYETELLCSNNNFQGYIILNEKYIIFQTNMSFDFNKYKNDPKYILSSKKEEILQIPKQVIIPYKSINQILRRKFVFFNQAFEIFLLNGKSYFFNLYNKLIY